MITECYKRESQSDECVRYSEADWAGELNDRKSTSGYVFQLNGAVISWRSNKQSCVALSTAEGVYIALVSTVREAMWLRQLISDLSSASAKSVGINEDNQSALA